ncbi:MULTISPECIES: carbon-nitrogen hydrolase family protein [Thiorhodovibrio]|jgi:nitrilase|uniref:carbon-nitrogen hydrolase family protein n=1 Tax=Thiorhodovibrio TaxID=61593 RepID=UPI001912DC6C|nr:MULTISPECIES: carbon-nitrogen hydrolase family protein [Thiorhodovibrio]MBK5969889.1 acyltransferase [Thiorhodovibrio winogradskyi]WPL12066.1 (R)-stereoselective amidase [Thiorhodovibrio litoralis]
MSKPMRAAAIQMASGPSVDSNLIEVERLIKEAAEMGAALVVLPENFAFMGKKDQDQLGIAEPPGKGPLQEFLSGIADRLGIWLVGGTIPLQASAPDRVRSAALVFDASGQQVARYDKMHLFDVSLPGSEERYHESATIEPGDSLTVVETPLGRLGVAVCYDLRFPELCRQMLDQGVELLAIPSSFTALTGKAHWEVLVRARAIENLAYVVAAAQGGYHLNGRETHGHSMIVDPWGAILAQVPRGSGCICCPIDLGFQQSVRRSFPVLDHRRLKCQLAADT